MSGYGRRKLLLRCQKMIMIYKYIILDLVKENIKLQQLLNCNTTLYTFFVRFSSIMQCKMVYKLYMSSNLLKNTAFHSV